MSEAKFLTAFLYSKLKKVISAAVRMFYFLGEVCGSGTRSNVKVEMWLRKNQGHRCCKKVRGHPSEPEIQSVMVRIQLDGVHD